LSFLRPPAIAAPRPGETARRPSRRSVTGPVDVHDDDLLEDLASRFDDAESVRLLRFVKRAQGLGFSLREVPALLRLRETRGVPCAQVRTRAEHKIAEIVAKERQLAAIRRALEKLVASCRTERSRRECPILEALAANGEPQR